MKKQLGYIPKPVLSQKKAKRIVVNNIKGLIWFPLFPIHRIASLNTLENTPPETRPNLRPIQKRDY